MIYLEYAVKQKIRVNRKNMGNGKDSWKWDVGLIITAKKEDPIELNQLLGKLFCGLVHKIKKYADLKIATCNSYYINTVLTDFFKS